MGAHDGSVRLHVHERARRLVEAGAPHIVVVGTYERRLIEDALRSTHGNRARAARILQTTERILGYPVEELLISSDVK